jgi:branched-chain amino acid transport system ATP-binding protein
VHFRPPTPMADSGPLLSLRGVSKSFGGIQAVHDISFDVTPGECLGLVGPNGAGKTTLFNCVCGQLRPDSGDIVFDGAPLIGLPTYKRARLGIGRTYQKVEVFTDMSVRDHLMVAERARRGESRLWRDLLNLSKPTMDELERVDATLELVGITRLAATSVNALGLGNCRLVELARALAAEPKILLADEPSSGLDLHETSEVASVLRHVQRERGTAILLVEHDLAMVAEVVDRTVVMDLGAMLAEGTFDEVMADPLVRHAYLGQMGAV